MQPLAYAPTHSINTDRTDAPSPSDGLKLHDKAEIRAVSNTVEMIDCIFNTLRSTKISVNAFHAVIKLHMETVNKNGKLTLSGLAGKLGITTAATTGIADSMENLGFARRVVDPSDRRVVLLELTSRGSIFAESFYLNSRAEN